jgi:hypothetical protein
MDEHRRQLEGTVMFSNDPIEIKIARAVELGLLDQLDSSHSDPLGLGFNLTLLGMVFIEDPRVRFRNNTFTHVPDPPENPPTMVDWASSESDKLNVEIQLIQELVSETHPAQPATASCPKILSGTLSVFASVAVSNVVHWWGVSSEKAASALRLTSKVRKIK